MSVSQQRRKAIAFALTLGSAALLAEAAKPRARDEARAKIPLETIFPPAFGDWRVDALAQAFVQPADDNGKIYGFYDQVLERSYRNAAGGQIMLCIAYGREQSPALQVHRPEICYGAGGYHIDGLQRVQLPFGARRIHATRLHAWKVGRSEPVTYWTVLGETVVDDSQSFRWRQIALGLQGQVRDGMLVRISSIDRDAAAGYRLHAAFAEDLLRAMPAQHRDRVFGAA
jgi:EpsI family protein